VTTIIKISAEICSSFICRGTYLIYKLWCWCKLL